MPSCTAALPASSLPRDALPRDVCFLLPCSAMQGAYSSEAPPGVPAALHTWVQAAAGAADRMEEKCHLRLLGPRGA